MKKIEAAPNYHDFIFKRSNKLTELLSNEEFNKLVNEVNEDYYYWDKVKYTKTPEGITAEALWSVARFRRNNTPFKVQFGKYSFSWFLTAKIQELLHLFDLNIGGSLEAKGIIPQEEKSRYLISSIMVAQHLILFARDASGGQTNASYYSLKLQNAAVPAE